MKFALNVQLQTVQILTNDLQILILFISYFIATVVRRGFKEIDTFTTVLFSTAKYTTRKHRFGTILKFLWVQTFLSEVHPGGVLTFIAEALF